MINSISRIPTFQIPLPPWAISIAEKSASLSTKISVVADAIFLPGCAVFLGIQGLSEMFSARKAPSAPTNGLLSHHYLQTHGSFLLGSGVCTGLDVLHKWEFINLGSLLKVFQGIGSFLFLYANVFALEKNINQYESLRQKISDHQPSPHEKWLLRGALAGILSNLGYITATAAAVFGAATAIALLIGVISACFGNLKILYDFLGERSLRASQEKLVTI